jgi:hypothetical protein
MGFIRLALLGEPGQAKVLFCKRCFGVLPCVRLTFFYIAYLLFSLFSAVELENGKIEIDGYDVRSVGLGVLRRGLALVPQDSTLFLGTLRDNL